MGDTEKSTLTGERAGELDTETRVAANDLLAETSRAVSQDAHLYYYRLRFDADTSTVHQRKTILAELTNALDVWALRPELAELSSTDRDIELLIEMRMQPDQVVEALDHACIDTVTYHELEPDAFGLEIAETAKSDANTVTAEFEELRREYTDGGGADDPDRGSGPAAFAEPRTVQFSEDEVGFDELLGAPAGEPGAPSAAAQQPESLVEALVTELEDGTADADDVERLGELLDRSPANSVAARLDHLQSRMETFDAYLDALEAFIDEEGTAQQLLEEVRTELETLRDDLQTAADERDALRTRIAELEATVPSADDVDAELERLEQALETATDDIRADVDEVDAQLEAVQTELADHEAWRHRLATAVATTDPAESGCGNP